MDATKGKAMNMYHLTLTDSKQKVEHEHEKDLQSLRGDLALMPQRQNQCP